MIRVRIELIPAGVEELGVEIEKLFINCKYPLTDPTSQNLQVFSERGMGYAEIDNYNLQDTVYILAPCDGKHYLDLIECAIHELKEQKTTRTGKEIYPGFMRLTDDIEERLFQWIGKRHKRIQTITKFGDEIIPDSLSTALSIRPESRFDGSEIFKNYPQYKPRYVAIRLEKELYEDMKQAELIENIITAECSVRPHPHVKNMQCFNGLLFFFLRPDNTIFYSTGEQLVTADTPLNLGDELKIEKFIYTLDELQKAIQSGQVVYRRSEVGRKRHKK